MKIVDILLVEDNPDDAELSLYAFNTSLEKLTPKLWHVTDGVEALKFIFGDDAKESDSPVNVKLIILDIKMPRLNGFDVLKALKDDKRTQDIPVIILTSSKEKSDLLQAYNLGVDKYIVKPIAFEEYISTIAEIGAYWRKMNKPTVDDRIKKITVPVR